MESVGYATLQLIPSLDGLEQKVNSQLTPATNRAASKAGTTSGGIFGRGFFTTVGHIMVASALYQVGQGIASGIGKGIAVGLKTASFLQEAEISFETLLGNGGKAQQLLSQLSAFAAKTPFQIEGVTTAAQQLLGAGSAAKDVIPTLTALGDTEAALGGSQDDFNHTLTAWTQLMTRGKIDTQDLLQISNQGIPIWKELAKAVGVPATAIQDLVSKGKLLSADVLPKLQAQLEKDYGGSMAKQATTLAGVWSTVQDTISMALGQAFLPLAPILASILPGAAQKLANAILATSTGIQRLSAWIGTLIHGSVGAGIFASLIGPFQEAAAAVAPYIGAIGDTFKQMLGPLLALAPAFNPISFAFHALLPVIPVIAGALAQLVSGVLPMLLPLVNLVAQAFTQFASQSAQIVAGVLPPLIGLFLRLVPAVAPIVTQLFNLAWQIIPVLTDALSTVGAAVGGVFTQAIGIAISVLPAFLGIFQSLVPVFGMLVTALGPLVANLVGQLVPAITGIVSAVLPAFSGLLRSLVPVFSQIVTAIAPLIAMLIGSLVPVVLQLVTAILPIFTQLFAEIAPVLTAVVTAIAPLVSALVSALLPAFTQIAAQLLPSLVSLFSALLPILSPLITLISQIAQIILSLIVPVIKALLPLVTTIIGAIIGVITPIITVLTGVAQFLTGVFTGNWSLAWTGLQNIAKGVWDLIVNLIVGAIHIIGAVVVAGVKLIATGWNAFWALFADVVTAAWRLVSGVVGNAIKTLVGQVKAIGGLVKGALSGAGHWLYDIGKSIIDGLIKGIKAAIGGVKSAFTTLTKNIPNWKGPASVDRVLLFGPGQMIMGGLIKGIGSQRDALRSELGAVTRDISLGNGALSAYQALAAPGGATVPRTGVQQAATSEKPNVHIEQTVNVDGSPDPHEIVAIADLDLKNKMKGVFS